jgi:predicted aconitase
MGLRLTETERAMLAGGEGPAVALAMELIVALAEAVRAPRLIEIESAHIDSCLYHGEVGLRFAERLVADGGKVRVPTTLNIAALDLLHPDLVRLDQPTRERARRQMDAYVALGCAPTWTCAPYQLPERPARGAHVAWAESNAIVFANSVLGARTARYGDFADICAALTGRVPYAGLHRDADRHARIVFELGELADAAFDDDSLYGLLGQVIGRGAGSHVPVLVGLPPERATEDRLKALGAAAASVGAVALCHVVGVTPEAPTLAAALGGARPTAVTQITRATLRAAWQELNTADDSASLGTVSLGTPHFSRAEFDQLLAALAGRRAAVPLYVSTARHIVAELERADAAVRLRAAGVTLVTDTCTYVTPILRSDSAGAVMTNSAKWAWYAPANLGVQVVYASLADCVESAVSGSMVRRPPAWLDG